MKDELTLEGVTKSYEARTILHQVSLRAVPGETVAIVGPSGSGKSTLLNIIGALDGPDAGTVQLGEIAVHTLSGRALADYRARKIGFVFQEHHLLPQLTALENVLLPTTALCRSEGREKAERAVKLLDRIGVAHRGSAFPAQMSGGERQRVAVARALINGPALLLCDEPTGSLDFENGVSVVSLLAEIAAQESVIALMVTHNAEHAARFSRCLLLRDGRLEAHP